MGHNNNLTIGILGNTDKEQTYYNSQILACLITQWVPLSCMMNIVKVTCNNFDHEFPLFVVSKACFITGIPSVNKKAHCTSK